MKQFITTHRTKIVASLLTILLMVWIGLCFDVYYDLNDDVMINDILAGNYTGTSSAYSIQLLYPLSFLLSLCYLVMGSVNWYGLFLCGAIYICCYLLVERTMSFGKKWMTQMLLGLAAFALFILFFYYTFIMVQYTVVAGLLTATGAFLLVTGEMESTWQGFLRKNIGNIVLIVMGFCLREEMVLLLMPFVGLAGIFRWSVEVSMFSFKQMQKYIISFLALLGSMGICYIIHFVAYGSEEWNTFFHFFDARTQLYDYTGIPDYEKNQEFYEELGLGKEQQQLLLEYSFGLEPEIDEVIMSALADHATNLQSVAYPFEDRIKQSILEYKYRTLNFTQGSREQTDFPLNFVVLMLYGFLFVCAILYKRYGYLVHIVLLSIVRSGLWLFIIYGLRTPVRITVPLYFMEVCMLCGYLLVLHRNSTKIQKSMGIFLAGMLCITACSQVGMVHDNIKDELEVREQNNVANLEIREYAKEHADEFLLLDVYSVVSFSEKIFVDRENLLDNYGIISSWAANSPLEREKYNHFGLAPIGEALLTEEHVVVVHKVERPLDWLEAYYESKGIEITLEEVARLADNTYAIERIVTK